MRKIALLIVICLSVVSSTALAQTQNLPSENELETSPIDVQKARSLADEFVDDLINDRQDKIKTKLDEKFWSQEYKDVEKNQLWQTDTIVQGWKPLECKFSYDKTELFFDPHRGREIPSIKFVYICKTTNPDVMSQKTGWERGVKAIVVQDKNQLRIRDFKMDIFWEKPKPDENSSIEVLDGNF